MKYNRKKNLAFLILIFSANLLVGNNNFKKYGEPAINFAKKAATEKFNFLTSSRTQSFIENKGQILGFDSSLQPAVKFVCQQGNTQLFLLERGIAYQFTKIDYPEGYKDLLKNRSAVLKNSEKFLAMQKLVRTETFRMDMTLVGANLNAEITTEGKSIDYTNYYNRNVLDVHSYNKITYHDIYPGIDWVIYSKDGAVKYDFIVKSGADPSLIKMEFKHQESLTLNENGSFTLKNRMGTITEKKPLSFQENKEISTKYVIKENSISFALGEYDSTQILTIDPSLIWATYYGGSGTDNGNFCTTDVFGNVYLVGSTAAIANIALGGYQIIYGGGFSDAYLVKFDANGTRLWATYYGGLGLDAGFCCAVDASGNIYLGGRTSSPSNIASGGHQNVYGGSSGDAFLVKFNSSGLRLWATYYGGLSDEYGHGCSVDLAGNVYLAGYTSSTTSNIASGGFQNTHGGGFFDAFLVKFDSNGIRQWGTYYGGSGIEFGASCATDAAGNIYLGGSTTSTLNVASGGHQNSPGGSDDAFLVKFNTNGQRLWATFYGGSASDIAHACSVDPSGNVYIAGQTISPTNIAFGGYQNIPGISDDAFLAKFSSGGVRLWATYYGSYDTDQGYSCATDNLGNVYLAGITSSSNNIASGGYQNNSGGSGDAMLVKFDSSGLRLWATYYGGNASDVGNYCAVDPWGNIYLAGDANSSTNIATGGYQNISGGGTDAFLAKFCDGGPGQPSPIIGSYTVCINSNQTYSIIPVTGATSYSWNIPTGWVGTSSTNSIILTPVASGTVSVSAHDVCGNGAAQTVNIIVNPTPTLLITGNNSVCDGLSTTQLVNGSSVTYTWSNGMNGNVVTLTPSVTTAFTVTGTNIFGCTNYVTKAIIVNSLPNLIVTSPSSVICSGETLLLSVSGANFYTWDNNSNGNQISITPSNTTTYSVMGTDINGCSNSTALIQVVDACMGISSLIKNNNIQLEVYPNPVTYKLYFEFANAFTENVKLIISNTLGQIVYSKNNIDLKNDLDVSFLKTGIYYVKLECKDDQKVYKIVRE